MDGIEQSYCWFDLVPPNSLRVLSFPALPGEWCSRVASQKGWGRLSAVFGWGTFPKTTVGWMLGMLGEREPPNYQLKSFIRNCEVLWEGPLQLFNIHGRALHRPMRLMLRARQRCRVVAETCWDNCDMVRDILQGSYWNIQTARKMLWVHSHLWISLRTQIPMRSFLDHSWWPSELWEHRFKSLPAFLRHILPISLSQHQRQSWNCTHRHIWLQFFVKAIKHCWKHLRLSCTFSGDTAEDLHPESNTTWSYFRMWL